MRVHVPRDADEDAIERAIAQAGVDGAVVFPVGAIYNLHRTLHFPPGRDYRGNGSRLQAVEPFDGSAVIEVEPHTIATVHRVWWRAALRWIAWKFGHPRESLPLTFIHDFHVVGVGHHPTLAEHLQWLENLRATGALDEDAEEDVP